MKPIKLTAAAIAVALSTAVMASTAHAAPRTSTSSATHVAVEFIDGRPVVRYVNAATAASLHRRDVAVSANTAVSILGLTVASIDVPAGPAPASPVAPPEPDVPTEVVVLPPPLIARQPNLVAVVDSGVDASHPALAGRVAAGQNFGAEPNSETEPWLDGNGHGTGVAGVVLQGNPAATILPVRVMDNDGNGSAGEVVQGIIWAVDNGASVINLSLGFTDSNLPKALQAALQHAAAHNVIVVAAAGNEAQDGSPVLMPAAADDTIAVAAVDIRGRVAYFSNRNRYVDISARGVDVKVPALEGRFDLSSGTSIAAPAVAATASRLEALHPEWSAADVRNQLLATATDAGNPGPDMAYGHGVLNADKALTAPQSAPASVTAGPSPFRRPLIAERVKGGVFLDIKKSDRDIFTRDSNGAVTVVEADSPFLRVALTGSYQVWTYDSGGVPTVEVEKTFVASSLPVIKATATYRNGFVLVRLLSTLPKGLMVMSTTPPSRGGQTIAYSQEPVFDAADVRVKTLTICYVITDETFGCRKVRVR